MNNPNTAGGYQTFTDITTSVNKVLYGSKIKGIAASGTGTFFVITDNDYIFSWGSNNYNSKSSPDFEGTSIRFSKLSWSSNANSLTFVSFLSFFFSFNLILYYMHAKLKGKV